MDDVLLFAISLGVTVIGLLGSWGAYRRRGAASGMRGVAWSLVPMGAYLTGTTEFFAELALSPSKWAGVVVVGLAVVLYMVSGVMLRRGAGQGGTGAARAPESPKAAKGRSGRPAKGAVEQGKPEASGLGDDLGDIQDILKRRGIS
ncbi:MAG TPA: hypothetical protein VE465_09965 [Streptosporangiaceae bacterium]|jgi:hypothetical protein|nr:hypothetical protein [Streptosporangiaceae bacterium]